MNYQIYKSADKIGQAAAMLIVSQIIKKNDSVLGFATGSTPIPTYREMIWAYEEGLVDYAQVTSFNLDEYCGLPSEHEQSFYHFMTENLFKHINIPREHIHIPNGLAVDVNAECKAYDDAIKHNGNIDLQLLGVGKNGHIGFNEPCDSFVFATHQVSLSTSTIEANKRFFTSVEDVPHQAITMGIGSIMKAKSIVLLATGKQKAEAVRQMIKEDPSPSCPASILQFHPLVTVLLDEEAASLL